MTDTGNRTWVVTITDGASGGRLTEIAVRAPRASAAVQVIRDAGVHERSMHPGIRQTDGQLPWPGDLAVVLLQRRIGLGKDAQWRPVTTDRLP